MERRAFFSRFLGGAVAAVVGTKIIPRPQPPEPRAYFQWKEVEGRIVVSRDEGRTWHYGWMLPPRVTDGK